MNGWVDERADGWMNMMNGWTDEGQTDEWMDRWGDTGTDLRKRHNKITCTRKQTFRVNN